MKLLQFSTSHYCRKARLALGYKGIPYTVENLTPGLHTLKLRPLTGLTTLPVLLPELAGQPTAIADSTAILQFLQTYQPEPSYALLDAQQQSQALMLEDWLDESIGVATRFVYYDFRAGVGKSLDSSFASQAVIQVVRWQYGITPAAVDLATKRLTLALEVLASQWQTPFLVGNQFSVADIAAAALLSPLARIPVYQQTYPWLFERIAQIHDRCHEPLPPGFASSATGAF
ncbi:MAG: glutathione S-transferase family protein [Leptolyngbyaceae cyanobacterium bins.349]|nr:glutathione S-transferase family protein [Leptolyngbyaceae cyanobacterium bins.349]